MAAAAAPTSNSNSNSNTSDGRPAKRTRFSTPEAEQPGPRAADHPQQKLGQEPEVSGAPHTPGFSSDGRSGREDRAHRGSEAKDPQPASPSTTIPPPLAPQTPSDRQDSLTPLSEPRSEEENNPLTAEVSENDPEISQYDIWSDCEQEDFDQSELPHNGLLPTASQLTSSTAVQEQQQLTASTPHQPKPPDPPNEPDHAPSQSKKSQLSPDHRQSSAQFIIPRRSISSPLRPPSNPNPAPKTKRTVSSLFTTGTGEPFPMAIHPPSSGSPTFQPAILYPPPTATSAQKSTPEERQTRPMDDDALPYLPAAKPRRALSSLFQTGAGQPFPMDEPAEETSSSSAAQTQDCPVFGFQTARGTPVAPPSKDAMRKALDICAHPALSPFPKPHYTEPDSPSPSHRAKIQKASQLSCSSSVSPSSRANGANKSPTEDSRPIVRAPTPSSSSMPPPPTKLDSSKPSVGGLFSTASGTPIHIPISAIERARAHLDNPSQSSDSRPPPTNRAGSPLKDVSNLRPAPHSHHRLSATTDLLTGVGTRPSGHPSLSAKLHESLSAVVPKIPSQPTTAATLMSTPVRTLSSGMTVRSALQDSPNEPPSLPHTTTTAPVRRISNRIHIGLTPQATSRRASREGKAQEPRSFVTPFKKKLEPMPGQPVSLCTPARTAFYPAQETPSADPSRRSVMYIDPVTPFGRQGSSGGKPQSVFDLSTRSRQKIPMAQWLASPKGYSARHLLSLAVPESVVYMTAKSAAIWTFNAFTEPFGALQALGELLHAGCSISRCSPKWVANHWALIVWKLAAFVRWQPDCLSRVWKPSNAVQQLKYRYEREFVRGDRPVLQRILENDCPPSMPMCLVIVGIVRRSSPSSSSAIQGGPTVPEILELSDGWYRIKAHLDPVLLRVLRRGGLRVGFKLAISGATTEAPPPVATTALNKTPGEKKKRAPVKETEDEGEDEACLYLEGNATARARWHEPLGLRPRPWIAALRSLSHDGGRIPLLDIVIVKLFPPMFVDQEGRMGRWGIAEENMLQLAWEKEREKEADNVAQEQEKELEKIQLVADLVATVHAAKSDGKRRSSGGDKSAEEERSSLEDAAFDADDLCEELLEDEVSSDALTHLSGAQLVQLRESAQRRYDAFRSTAADEGRKMLDMRVPPRRTRHVQQLSVIDFHVSNAASRTTMTMAGRLVGQISVQDLSLLPEQFLKEGCRYWVENLQPSRSARWDVCARTKTARPELREINLSTRRDTRWTSIALDA
ncbi:hypothetical protein PtB15_1B569 [Puccinia triticina]|nr:hypothetical protein PtB15_1B569 [Puccinia triticina]